MYSRCRNFPIRNYSFLRYPITYAIFMLIILHSKQDSPAQYFIFLKMSVHTLIKPLYVVISDTGRLFFRNFLLNWYCVPKEHFWWCKFGKCPILPKKVSCALFRIYRNMIKITFARQTTKRDIKRIAKSK